MSGGRVVVFMLLAIAVARSESPDKPPPKHYNIVLIGATGDLAEKYLWRALFDLVTQHQVDGEVHFAIYGCARRDPSESRVLLSKILLSAIQCGDDSCRARKKSFIESVQFHQLKTEAHYKALANKIAENTQSMYGLLNTDFSYERGRLVYLSTPPTHYARTTKYVGKYLRPRLGRDVWMRVVLEKPFGSDSESARALSEKIKEHFKETEIYRVDHYLGKTTVKQILPFRYINAEFYGHLWNRHHIEAVEIVMKEKVDTKGRTAFYDDLGVLRDMLQNHLMEVMALVAMEMPKNSGDIQALLDNKLRLYKQTRVVNPVLLGQYATYNSEWREESGAVTNTSHTPTYAACLIKIDNARWRDVPFLLISGKKMDEKASFVRIKFKSDKFCVSTSDTACGHKSEIFFHISADDLDVFPHIIVSGDLSKPKPSSGWKSEQVSQPVTGDIYKLVAENEEDAYSNVMRGVFDGDRHMFLDEASLMASWDIWTPVIKESLSKIPQIYVGGTTDMENLDFRLNGDKLEFIVSQEVIQVDVPTGSSPPTQFKHIPGSCLGLPLVSAPPSELIEKLSQYVLDSAQSAVTARGMFHLALPGGASPVPLFRKMASPDMAEFPWEQTHIWLVDERCVPFSDPDSNFHSLHENLLKFVPIPYWNIHPLPVNLGGELCPEGSAQIYTSTIQSLCSNMSLDLTILGLGADGHVGSLFPNQSQPSSLVAMTTAPAGKASPRRMTMNFDLINKSKDIVISVRGSWKFGVVQKLLAASGVEDGRGHGDGRVQWGEALREELPVSQVRSVVGNTTFYIDHDALLGTTT